MDPEGKERRHCLETAGEVDEVRDRRTRGGQEREAGPIEGEGEGEVEVEVEAGIVGGGRCELEMPSSLSLLLPCLRDLEIASTEMPRDRRWRSLMTGKRAAPFRRR